jgi:hypothetical protein
VNLSVSNFISIVAVRSLETADYSMYSPLRACAQCPCGGHGLVYMQDGHILITGAEIFRGLLAILDKLTWLIYQECFPSPRYSDCVMHAS